MNKGMIAGIAGLGLVAFCGAGFGAYELGHSHPSVQRVTVAAPAPKHSADKPKIIVRPKITVTQPPAAPAPQTAPAVPTLREVGNSGIFANSNTSDAFALNVASSWNGQPGTQMVYSPVTGQSYAITYTVVGGTVTATGGNDAYVQF